MHGLPHTLPNDGGGMLFTRIRARERFTLFFLASELEARPELRGISAGLKAIASVGIGIVAIVICCLLSYFN